MALTRVLRLVGGVLLLSLSGSVMIENFHDRLKAANQLTTTRADSKVARGNLWPPPEKIPTPAGGPMKSEVARPTSIHDHVHLPGLIDSAGHEVRRPHPDYLPNGLKAKPAAANEVAANTPPGAHYGHPKQQPDTTVPKPASPAISTPTSYHHLLTKKQSDAIKPKPSASPVVSPLGYFPLSTAQKAAASKPGPAATPAVQVFPSPIADHHVLAKPQADAIQSKHVAVAVKKPVPAVHSMYCTPPPGQVPALWFPPTLSNPNLTSWLNITTIANSIPSRRNSSSPRNKRARIFDIDHEFAQHMDELYALSTFREKPPGVRMADRNGSDFNQSFYDDYFGLDIPDDGVRLATFNNVLVNRYGVVADPFRCNLHVQLGGCITTHTKVFSFASYPVRHDLVISLGSGASGTWHFPMELLVALRNVPTDVLSTATIHVPSKTGYILAWLQQIPGVKPEQVSDLPVILAKRLLAPQMGFCGLPSPPQVEWLASVVAPTAAASTRNIILVQRLKSNRKISNQEAVLSTVQAFATAHQYNLILHDDTKMPPLRTQIDQFASSDIVVMPHGAAGLFTNFSPERACLVEFHPPSGWNLCYARLAYMRNLNYFGRMQVGANEISISLLNRGLNQCLYALGG